jgi:glutamate synthase domain-containing protein 2
VVDGNEGGIGAASLEFMDHLGMPMREGGKPTAVSAGFSDTYH